MKIKITKKIIAEMFGYSRYDFSVTWTSEQRRLRFDWLRTGAILEHNGISHKEALAMGQTISMLKQELIIHRDKMEALKSIKKLIKKS